VRKQTTNRDLMPEKELLQREESNRFVVSETRLQDCFYQLRDWFVDMNDARPIDRDKNLTTITGF
jgi:hypothetical protein